MKSRKTSKRKLVYSSKDPCFTVSCDKYQWVLAVGNKKSYHPTICSLFDELAESLFRGCTEKIKELSEIEKTVVKVYGLCDKAEREIRGTFK
jgi:hypothetical protein